MELLKVPLPHIGKEYIFLANHEAVHAGQLRLNLPIVVDKNVVYYASEQSTSVAVLFILNWEGKRWFRFEMDSVLSHSVNGQELRLHAAIGCLYFHGRCSQPDCEDKAHTYIIDVRGDVQKKINEHTDSRYEARSSFDLPEPQQLTKVVDEEEDRQRRRRKLQKKTKLLNDNGDEKRMTSEEETEKWHREGNTDSVNQENKYMKDSETQQKALNEVECIGPPPEAQEYQSQVGKQEIEKLAQEHRAQTAYRQNDGEKAEEKYYGEDGDEIIHEEQNGDKVGEVVVYREVNDELRRKCSSTANAKLEDEDQLIDESWKKMSTQQQSLFRLVERGLRRSAEEPVIDESVDQQSGNGMDSGSKGLQQSLEEAESVRRAFEMEEASRRATTEKIEKLQAENIHLRLMTKKKRGTDKEVLQQVLQDLDNAQNAFKMEEVQRLVAEEEIDQLRGACEALQLALDDAERALQRALDESDLAKRSLQLEQARQLVAEQEIEKQEQERDEEHARRKMAEEKKQKADREILQRAVNEAERLRFALEHEQRERRVAEEKAECLRKEKEADEARRMAARKWTPTNYKKEEELGKGAFGIVHKCFDTDEHRFFVAKETFSPNHEILDTAMNEIDRLKAIAHVRIVDYYGYKSLGNTVIIFMEYMAAGSLKQLIYNYGSIKEKASIKYIEQILDALAYIHNIGIIHLDLKCDNLLHDGQGNVKLGDFGIAVQKKINAIDQSYFMQSSKRGGGTVHWSAPEMLNGDKCSRRSDIWSLGCTIVEMLSGHPPYAHLTTPVLMFNVMGAMRGMQNEVSYDPEELVPSSSGTMKKFLSCLLVVDLNKRLRSGAETMEMFKKTF